MFNYKIKLLLFSIEYFKFSKSICLIEANEGMKKYYDSIYLHIIDPTNTI